MLPSNQYPLAYLPRYRPSPKLLLIGDLALCVCTSRMRQGRCCIGVQCVKKSLFRNDDLARQESCQRSVTDATMS